MQTIFKKLTLYGTRKCPYPPHVWSLEILREWGVSKAKSFLKKENIKLNWKFLRGVCVCVCVGGGEGWGVEGKQPPTGEVWIFSGTTLDRV